MFIILIRNNISFSWYSFISPNSNFKRYCYRLLWKVIAKGEKNPSYSKGIVADILLEEWSPQILLVIALWKNCPVLPFNNLGVWWTLQKYWWIYFTLLALSDYFSPRKVGMLSSLAFLFIFLSMATSIHFRLPRWINMNGGFPLKSG